MELVGFLLESNEARQAVARDDDLWDDRDRRERRSSLRCV